MFPHVLEVFDALRFQLSFEDVIGLGRLPFNRISLDSWTPYFSSKIFSHLSRFNWISIVKYKLCFNTVTIWLCTVGIVYYLKVDFPWNQSAQLPLLLLKSTSTSPQKLPIPTYSFSTIYKSINAVFSRTSSVAPKLLFRGPVPVIVQSPKMLYVSPAVLNW